MGEGALSGMPLQLAGTRKILEFMDWGEYDVYGTFISIGSIGMQLKANVFSLSAFSSCYDAHQKIFFFKFINWVGHNYEKKKM